MSKKHHFERELEFVRKYLDFHHISHYTYSLEEDFTPSEDLGIRNKLVFSLQNWENIKSLFSKSLLPNTLSYLTDELSCHYITIPFPAQDISHLFVIGPYIMPEETSTIQNFLSQSSLPVPWIPILKKYYFQISSPINSDTISGLVVTLADYIYGRDNYQIQHLESGLPDTITTFAASSDPLKHIDLFSNIKLIETLYTAENQLANAIAHGQSAQARAIFSTLPLNEFRYELEPLRNLKNFSIISNTIFRKAAERGGVHPLYIDQLSSSYMTRIENMNRSDNVFDLWIDMIQKYCGLVNTYNTRNYSLPIQRVITRIHFDLTADLSLKATANFLNTNASYLSNLFKKETGYTLTNYVNKKRIEHAIFLLSTTTLPISSIAQQCGILDDNYFTKLFKRQYHMTPSQYRNAISHDDIEK